MGIAEDGLSAAVRTWIAESWDTDITVKRRDGVSQTISVDENTSFKKHRDSITLADIQVGDRLMAQGAVKGSSFLATSVTVGTYTTVGLGTGENGEKAALINTSEVGGGTITAAVSGPGTTTASAYSRKCSAPICAAGVTNEKYG